MSKADLKRREFIKQIGEIGLGMLFIPYVPTLDDSVQKNSIYARKIADHIISEAKKDQRYPGNYHSKNRVGWEAEKAFNSGYRVNVYGDAENKNKATAIYLEGIKGSNGDFTDIGLDGICESAVIETPEGILEFDNKISKRPKHFINGRKVKDKDGKYSTLISKEYGKALMNIIKQYEL